MSAAAKRGRTEEPAATANLPAAVRALEFYCGVGGLHYSLRRRARLAARAWWARSTSTPTRATCLRIRHEADRTRSRCFSDETRHLRSSLWLMSPPCQPFTRQGAQRDAEDARAGSFLSLLRLVPRLRVKPTHVLVENVVGFETSETRDVLLRTLEQNGFDSREFILSPRMFGVPYSRPRYFCVAKTKGLRWADAERRKIRRRGRGRDGSCSRSASRASLAAALALPAPEALGASRVRDDRAGGPHRGDRARPRREDGQTGGAATAAAKGPQLSSADPLFHFAD